METSCVGGRTAGGSVVGSSTTGGVIGGISGTALLIPSGAGGATGKTGDGGATFANSVSAEGRTASGNGFAGSTKASFAVVAMAGGSVAGSPTTGAATGEISGIGRLNSSDGGGGIGGGTGSGAVATSFSGSAAATLPFSTGKVQPSSGINRGGGGGSWRLVSWPQCGQGTRQDLRPASCTTSNSIPLRQWSQRQTTNRGSNGVSSKTIPICPSGRA